MSWQQYVDDQIVAKIDCKTAAMGSLADGSLWGHFETAPQFAITADELKTIVTNMRSGPEYFQANGIRLGGEKFICLSAEEKLLRGRKGTSSMAVVATQTCVIAAVAKDGFSAGQLNTVVEKLADYLKTNNY